jgi:hypothetical protein
MGLILAGLAQTSMEDPRDRPQIDLLPVHAEFKFVVTDHFE